MGARDALEDSDCTLLDLRREPGNAKATDGFHRQHHVEDQRWSHAKLYRMKRGRTERVLVTSANFSPSAWGDAASNGSLHIRNFELGVALDDVAWPFENLGSLYPGRASVTEATVPTTAARIGWAQASWDGTQVVVDVRCLEPALLEGALVTSDQQQFPLPAFSTTQGFERSVLVFFPSQGTPRFVELQCGDERLTVIVSDNRPMAEQEDGTPPDGLDADTYQARLDEQLFEQYGGPAADDDGDDPVDHDGLPPPVPGIDEGTGVEGIEEVPGPDDIIAIAAAKRTDSYQVAAQATARVLLSMVDGWWSRMGRARQREPEGFEVDMLTRDGQRLIEALDRLAKRQNARSIGARLAAEELRTLTTMGSAS